AKTVEVRVAHDGVDGADSLHELGRHHLGARAVLGFRRQHEPRILRVARVLLVVVVIDPRREARAEPVDEGLRDLLEAAARGLGCERHIDDHDAPRERGCFGQLPRRGEGERCAHGLAIAFPVKLRWNEQGLLPVVALDRLTGEVRMLAWANAEALESTLRTRQATFFSRSRNALWQKGESSGNGMAVARVLVDCDEDTLVYEVEPSGPSCHTGKPSCFFRDVSGDDAARGPILVRLDDVLEERKSATATASYTRSLYE